MYNVYQQLWSSKLNEGKNVHRYTARGGKDCEREGERKKMWERDIEKRKKYKNYEVI